MVSKNREWMQYKKSDPRYKIGVKEFLEFAFSQKNAKAVVPCPCVKCNNERRKCRDEIELDLLKFGIVKSYTRWLRHGERVDDSTILDNIIDESNEYPLHEHDVMSDMLHDAFGVQSDNVVGDETIGVSESKDPPEAIKNFYKLMGDLELELYPGCKQFSKLPFLLKLFHIKCLGGISDKSLSMILDLFKEALPEGNTLPNSFYDAQKIIKSLSLESIKIDACPNNCMLFWKDHANTNECVKCHASRWKIDERNNESSTSQCKPRRTPRKTMRYFPLIPRIQRMYMSSKTAASMRWHSDERVDDPDGIMRHPADSKAWKFFDEKYPSFASEPRNVRLGLASDGFSPFRNGHIAHSTWPVVLIPYNLPPWLCMKQHSFILSMLIPGPKGPKDKIDVYLQPLIEELKLLWEVGAETYDASKKENFKMHASLLWTKSDYPAYGDLSGWKTGGAVGCPSCNSDTCSEWLPNGNKHCYMCHRRFLPLDHKWRYDGRTFDGKQELRPAPRPLSGEEVLQQIDAEQAECNKKKRKRDKKKTKQNKLWRKKSIFFELPYWSSLLIRHNLDVMHIEKNVCETLLGTLLDIEGKTKDNLNARLDLVEMKIRKSLHPITHPDKSKELPPAPHTLSLEQKRDLCNFLTSVKFPDGYASNISKNSLLKERKLSGLKSHDYHVIMEHLLPLAIRGWPKSLSAPLIQLSTFFKELCSKALKIDELEQLEKQIGVTLCELERIFPPSFFVIMLHLPIDPASEALIAGPVHYRWMYPIERYLGKLKGYVRNKGHPEGSIAEGYLLEECLTFCSRYMEDIETRFNKPDRIYDDRENFPTDILPIFETRGRAFGKECARLLTTKEWEEVHFYVLNNCDEVQSFIDEYTRNVTSNKKMISSHKRDFITWFRDQVTILSKENHPSVTTNLRALAQGPDRAVISLNGYMVNGFMFRTKDNERGRETQNSGIVVNGESGASILDYYGLLQEVIEVQYIGGNRVTLFKCDWWDVHSHGRGIYTDCFDFISINTSKLLANDPYILAAQARQVFYVNDVLKPNWKVIVRTTPRNSYDVPEVNDHDENNYMDTIYP